MLKFKDFCRIFEDIVPVEIDNEEIGKINRKDSQIIVNMINKLSPIVEEIKETLASFSFFPKDIDNIVHYLSEKDDLQKFSEFLKTRVDLKEIKSRAVVDDIFSQNITGLTPETIQNLMRLPWVNTSAAVGAGEVVIGLLIKGGSRPSGNVGDVEINGIKYEVKAGGAHFKGNKVQVGAPLDIRNEFYKAFDSRLRRNSSMMSDPDLTKKLRVKVTKKNDGGVESYSQKTNVFWNLYKDESKEWGIEVVSKVILKHDKEEKPDVINCIAKGLQKWMPQVDLLTFENLVKKYLEDDGSIKNKEQFIIELGIISYELYHKLESHEGMIFTDGTSKTKYKIVQLMDSSTTLKSIKTKAISTNPPSFSDGSGQGITCGFSIK